MDRNKLPKYFGLGQAYFNGKICSKCSSTEVGKLVWQNVNTLKVYSEKPNYQEDWCFECNKETNIIDHVDHVFNYLDEEEVKFLLYKFPREIDNETSAQNLRHLAIHILDSDIAVLDAARGLVLLLEKYKDK